MPSILSPMLPWMGSNLSEPTMTPHRAPEAQRRPRSPEIIDVDLLDDEDVAPRRSTTRPSSPRRRRVNEEGRSRGVSRNGSALPDDADVVILDDGGDSDDDVQFMGMSFNPQRQRQQQRIPRRTIFSPPPPNSRGSVPPVPPVPAHFRRRDIQPPMRRHPPPFPNDVIVAHDDPLPFEANIRAPAPNSNAGRAPAAAPRSHHTPTMGLGGALIARERHERYRPEPAGVEQEDMPRNALLRVGPRVQPGWGYDDRAFAIGGPWGRHADPLFGFGSDDEDDPDWDPEDVGGADRFFPQAMGDIDALAAHDAANSFGGWDRPRWGGWGWPGVWGGGAGLFGGRERAREKEPEYLPEYTHPKRLPAAFTADFAPPSPEEVKPDVIVVRDSSHSPRISRARPGASASSSAQKLEEEAPIAGGMTLVCPRCRDPLALGSADTGAKRERSRLWGLRCGHLLDGKCVDELSHPRAPTPPPSATPPVIVRPDPKGKGKAKATDTDMANTFDASTSVRMPGAFTYNDAPPPPYIHDPYESNPIRSRLRSHNSHPHFGPGASSSSQPSIPGPIPAPHQYPSVPSTPTSRRTAQHPTEPPVRASTRRGRTRPGPGRGRGGKGKGKAKGPVVEAEHSWCCPVAGCGREHLSLKIDGRWVPDVRRGAIGVYV
ncbi:hypothetical protein CONPUDRAFT_142255 [Coniophora puteana RWD-64-598 SS2]|uniref:Uncharacterized protein n=1 Tax=Coniophora puteana (strain RWD-64-598) TaxID=741705 RepID=A0A5M3MXX9_CONPW|nr:uncharacterized protein CONPUDRAFT_142255 [Coniophora puteana RWD-64-598 SS2]EIW83585.1 hypothetical protein CONPUDRAFT_142255 [Coniophora puteana RWD-64-598 SS2]